MDKLKTIICNYVDIKVADIRDDMSLNADLGLDSLSLTMMIMDIEESFGCEIPESAIHEFQTLNDLYSYVEENGTGI
ncbi:MAG: acyl carrier protein [Clostridia bacterium]|nr:acyl carrier protein [Clostridia bacterium]